MSQYFEESMLIEQPDETPEQLLARYEQQARAWRHRQGVETDERAATFAGDVAHMIEQLTGTLSTALSQTHEGRQALNSGVGGILVRELDELAEKTDDANLRSLLNRAGDHIEFIETDAHYRFMPTRQQVAARLRGDILDAVPDDNDMQHVLSLAAALLTQPNPTAVSLIERIGEHVAREYEGDATLDALVLEARALLSQPPVSLPTREQIAEAVRTGLPPRTGTVDIITDAVLALLQKGGDDTHAVSDDYWDEFDHA